MMLAVTALTGCHHHRAQVPLFGGNYPVKTIDVQKHVGEVHNLYYTEGGRSNEQTLDLYLPLEARPPYPLIIWVHGGSWMYGDKNQDCLACTTLSSKYAVASVNYRLDTEAWFPAQVFDLKAAVRFLRAHAKEYKLDPNRFGVWGTSAGGHLVALLGTSAGVKQLEGSEGNRKESSAVQAVCDWCGPTDFNSAASQAPPTNKVKFTGQSSPVFVFMGGRMDKDSLAKASPVTYVTKKTCPFLIMHGDLDDAIPPAQSQELYDLLKANGVDAQYHLLHGYGHSFSAPEHFKLVEDFFDDKLRARR